MDSLELAKWQLRGKLTTLRREILHWRRLSKKRTSQEPTFWANNSQIRSFAALIFGLYRQIEHELWQPGFTIADSKAYSKSVLGLFRIWEFLRSKLSQRLDSRLETPLRIADGFAWECYKPIAVRAYKEPPLVFLNGGLSPFILPRHQRFNAEFVPQELIQEDALNEATSSLPFPVIGIPWFQVALPWDLPVLGHEVGHTVEADLHLDLPALVCASVSDAARQKNWLAWASETFADYYGCLASGPAFVSTLADFLVGMRPTAEGQGYPPAALRFELNLAFLNGDFAKERSDLRHRWGPQFAFATKQEAAAVADCAGLAIRFRSLELGLPPFRRADQDIAVALADAALTKSNIVGVPGLRRLVSAIRIGYDRSVGQLGPGEVTSDLGRLDILVELLKETAKPDIRRIEPSVPKTTAQKERSRFWHARLDCSE